MNDIIENSERIGNFTSSQIYRLMKNGKKKGEPGAPFFTYVEEKKKERRLGRSLDTGGYSRASAWGSLLELYVNEFKLGREYAMTSNETDLHPKISCWAGSKDVMVIGVKVGDIKCYQPAKFCDYADMINSGDIERFKTEFEAEYWQLVSNAIINGVPKAEAIAFMPYQSELVKIRAYAENYDGPDQWKYRFIAEVPDSELAYIPDGNEAYKDMNKFEFEIPKSDIEALTERVKIAEALLTKDQLKISA